MASVELSGIYIHDVNDLATFVRIEALTGLTPAFAKHGEVRERDGGRLQYVGRPTRRATHHATGRIFDRETRQLLQDWVGTTRMFRDERGYLIYGVYHSVPFLEVHGVEARDVTLTVEEVTVDPAV